MPGVIKIYLNGTTKEIQIWPVGVESSVGMDKPSVYGFPCLQ